MVFIYIYYIFIILYLFIFIIYLFIYIYRQQEFVFYAYPSFRAGTTPFCVKETISNKIVHRVYVDVGKTDCTSSFWKTIAVFYAYVPQVVNSASSNTVVGETANENSNNNSNNNNNNNTETNVTPITTNGIFIDFIFCFN